MSLSLYRTKELGSGSRPSHSTAQYADHSFIAFLALAQRLEIPFLPITWQALLDSLGRGGQARVSQAVANVQTSFAFKRFRDDPNDIVDEDTPFQAVINEMIVLSHYAIRDHPYVVTLEGLCWDISADGDQVWPVLVFEKSIHGDLFEFVKAGCGSSLSTQEKLKLCTDIGIAIRDMHSNNIIHGDIKHQNVLIFEDQDHGFIAKMADFGFSSGFQGENDKISLPRSRPWNAPEYHDRYFFPEEAKRMDVYSFGLLCFWFLFGASGQLPLAPWMQYENVETISFEGNIESLVILENLMENQDDDLLRWIMWVINCQDAFKDARHDLGQFFCSTLVRKPEQRNMNFNDLLSSLAPNRAILSPLGQVKTDLLLAEEHFEIRLSILEFYRADFRLRSHIAASLLSISREIPAPLVRHISPKKASFQLALCHKIGFGVPKENTNACKLLEKSSQSWEDLENEISALKSATYMPARQTGIYLRMDDQGYVQHIDLPQYYLERNILEKAKHTYIQELQDIRQEFGDTHPICITLNINLSGIYRSQGHWAKAEELDIKIVEIYKRLRGPDHPDTLRSMSNLAGTYGDQGYWDKAEELGIEIMEKRKRLLGSDHSDTLTSMANLAATSRNRGYWNKAKELKAQAIEISKRLLGSEHPDTLTRMASLLVTYSDLGEWDKAEELGVKVVETRKRLVGPDHPETLTSMANLAAMYRNQGQWSKAEELGVKVVETRKRLIGPDHPETLRSMANLAATYSDLEHWDKAEELQLQLLNRHEKLLGLRHVDTVTSMENLVVIHCNQGHWNKAENLGVKVLEIRQEILGLDNPHTLRSLASLVIIYQKQGYWDKAEELRVQGVKIEIKVLGQSHSNPRVVIPSLTLIKRKLIITEPLIYVHLIHPT